MTPDPRLLVQATPELLDGWCGPVLLETQGLGWVPGVVLDGVAAILSEHGECKAVDALDDRKLAHVHLDLSRAECRDRIDRAIMAALDMPPNMRPEFTADEDGWSMLVGDLRDPAVGEMAVWDREGRAAGCCKIGAPGLAHVNPLDRALLPDGSRRADALARAAIWRAVGGGR